MNGWLAKVLGWGPWMLSAFLIPALILPTLLFPTAAQAEPIRIATLSQGNLFHRVGTEVAKLAALATRIKMLVVPYGRMADVLTAVDGRIADFAFADVNEVIAAVNGQGGFKEGVLRNLRIAANILPVPVALFVRKSSRYHTVKALIGRRLPRGKPEDFSGALFLEAILAASGMRARQFRGVAVSRRYPATPRFLRGGLDTMVFLMGGNMAARADARVRGMRALPVPYTFTALLSMQEVRPAYYISVVMPGPHNSGVERPTPMLTTDMVLVAHRNVSAAMVKTMIRVIAENKRALVRGNRRFTDFSPRWMAKTFPGVKYHPAALRYYQDTNLDRRRGRKKAG